MKDSLFMDTEECLCKRDRGKQGHCSERVEGQIEKLILDLPELCQLISCV